MKKLVAVWRLSAFNETGTGKVMEEISPSEMCEVSETQQAGEAFSTWNVESCSQGDAQRMAAQPWKSEKVAGHGYLMANMETGEVKWA